MPSEKKPQEKPKLSLQEAQKAFQQVEETAREDKTWDTGWVVHCQEHLFPTHSEGAESARVLNTTPLVVQCGLLSEYEPAGALMCCAVSHSYGQTRSWRLQFVNFGPVCRSEGFWKTCLQNTVFSLCCYVCFIDGLGFFGHEEVEPNLLIARRWMHQLAGRACRMKAPWRSTCWRGPCNALLPIDILQDGYTETIWMWVNTLHPSEHLMHDQLLVQLIEIK